MFRLEGAAKQSLSKLCLVINRRQQEKKFIDKYHIVLAYKYEMVFFSIIMHSLILVGEAII